MLWQSPIKWLTGGESDIFGQDQSDTSGMSTRDVIVLNMMYGQGRASIDRINRFADPVRYRIHVTNRNAEKIVAFTIMGRAINE